MFSSLYIIAFPEYGVVVFLYSVILFTVLAYAIMHNPYPNGVENGALHQVVAHHLLLDIDCDSTVAAHAFPTVPVRGKGIDKVLRPVVIPSIHCRLCGWKTLWSRNYSCAYEKNRMAKIASIFAFPFGSSKTRDNAAFIISCKQDGVALCFLRTSRCFRVRMPDF